MAGPFIVLDGPDGGGKSTQARALMKVFKQHDRTAVHLREPGSTKLSETIRRWLLHTKADMSMMTEAMLYTAARAQLVAERIQPALKAGSAVISERYYWSTVVYQGMAGALGREDMERLQELAVQDCQPDLTVILDLPPEIGLGRIKGRQDRIESRKLAYHRKVRSGFRTLAKEAGDSAVILDARKPKEWITERLLKLVEERFL